MPPLRIELDYDRGVPIYRQIVDAVLGALSTGALAREEQLPTIHELARSLGVNPNTVARAYRDLERDGHIVAHRGRGTFPSPANPPVETDREGLLRDIYHQALAQAARHGLTARDVIRYFRRAPHDRNDRTDRND